MFDARAAKLASCVLVATLLLAGAVLPALPRALQVLVFAAMLAALWETGSRLAAWLVPDLGLLSRWVAALSFAVGIAAIPAMWMGHFGILRPAVFLVWTAAALLASRLIPARPSPSADAAEPRAPERLARTEVTLLAVAAAAIALLALAGMLRLRFEPPGFYDDLSYHLSEVATWIRYGDLRMLRFSMGDTSTPFYPVLGEVVSWVLIAPFGDSDVAARWTQLPFALFSFVAVAAIARQLGLSRRSAALAAVLYAAVPHVFPRLALGAGNDHATSFFTLASLDGALALARRPRPGVAVVAGTSLGLLLATKYIGLLYAPTLLALLLLAGIAERLHADPAARTPWRALAAPAVLFVAAVAVAAGYTYVRNAATTGNPVFPIPVRVLGVEVFPGWPNILTSERDTSPEYQIDVWSFLARSKRLFGALFPFTLLPAAVLAPFVAMWRRRWLAALALALPLALFLEFRFLMHDHRDNRYILPAIALAAVAFVWLLEWIGPRSSLVRIALLAVVPFITLAALEIGNLRTLALALALLALGFLLAAAIRDGVLVRRVASLRWRWIVAALVAVAALPLGWAVATYQEVKLVSRPAPFALEQLAGPAGARVHYTGLNQPYLYFGGRLQNDLQIVPRNGYLAAQYYRWGSPIVDPYGPVTYRRWRRCLQARDIQLVVVDLTPWAEPERGWMAKRTRSFERVYQDAGIEIWRLLPERKAPRGRDGAGRPRPGRRGRAGEPTPAEGSGSRWSRSAGADRG